MNGKRHGFGKELRADGSVFYEGGWVADQREGEGKIFTAGQQLAFEGTFRMGKLNGSGKQYRSEGTVFYEGEWLDNQRHGQGTLFSKAGKVAFTGQFRNDQPVRT